MGHNYYAKKQIRVVGPVTIMLDNHKEQVFQSIPLSIYGDTSLQAKT
jgi:hypothetical protein